MGSTIAEKILARASGKSQVKSGEFVTANIDFAMANDGGMSQVYEILSRNGIETVFDPKRIACVLDHWYPAPTLRVAEIHKKIRQAIKKYQIPYFYGQGDGVAHNVLIEHGHILPGELIAGTDSHTPTYGAMGAAGAGIGFTEMAYVFTTGKLWFRVPESIKFVIKGKLSRRVAAKDVILFIAGKQPVEFAQYKSIEFSGETCDRMGISERITISNMAVELGAKFAFFRPNQIVIDYLKSRTQQPYEIQEADADAVYEFVSEEDISDLEPQVAVPSSLENVKPVSQVRNVKIDQAVLGSCTNGSLDDMIAAAEVMSGHKVHPDVRMLIIPASAKDFQDAVREGIIRTLSEAGAIIASPGCGCCFGSHTGLLASGEVCISTTNRNVKGRMGSPEAQIYLASPATVAASAIRGQIADPREF